jgi:molybdopterin synthase catalytic subunit
MNHFSEDRTLKDDLLGANLLESHSLAPDRFGVVLVTAPSQEQAEAIAHSLIQSKLAACINLLPVQSIYTWQGEIHKDNEWQLLIKTDLAKFSLLEAKIRAIHPYEVPEIIALPIQNGSFAYLQWMAEFMGSHQEDDRGDLQDHSPNNPPSNPPSNPQDHHQDHHHENGHKTNPDNFAIRFAPLSLEAVYSLANDPGNGAVVVMSGMVRNNTDGKSVVALEYQAYEPMALKVFQQIAVDIRKNWPQVSHVVIHHRTGRLQIGEISVLVAIGCPHRSEAFAACQYAIDTLKHNAPIWKKEWYDGPDGTLSSSWVSIAACEDLHL